MSCQTVKPTTLYINGRITTLDEQNPEASALAVQDGRIIATGSDKSIQTQFANPHQVIDLKNKRVLPGFIESHAHFISLGLSKMRLNLTGTRSEEEVLERVKQSIDTLSPTEWLQGRGWDQNDWPNKRFPTHKTLDQFAPKQPVVLTRIDGHALWCNQAAMKLAQVDKNTANPAGGKILRDQGGRLTGVFVDNAMSLITKHIPKPSATQLTRAAKLAAQHALSFGITSLHDAGSGADSINAFKNLIEENEKLPRLYVMLNGEDKELIQRYFKSGPQIDNQLSIRSIKYFSDGALGSRGAHLLKPYHDDPKNLGLQLISEDILSKKTQEAISNGFQVATHAIGDAANRHVLNAYEQALLSNPNKDRRLRIEHAQIIHPDDFERFNRLNVIASVQPTHCTSDMPWAPDRLGESRTRTHGYTWRSLLDAGAKLVAGSDAPIENLNPFLGLHAATTRGGHSPEQALTLEEAIKAFTIDAAYAEFQEHQKGMLKPGYLADFIVLSQDIFELPLDALPKTKVDMTVLDGKIVAKAGT